MDKRVERKILDKWIDMHGPDGLLELARASGVSSSTIAKARLGFIPKKHSTRDRLCKALNVSEAKLFPSVGADEGAAS